MEGLRRWGVEVVFGLPGVQLDGFFDALAQETPASASSTPATSRPPSYMADGYAPATGRVGVCAVVPGPGVLERRRPRSPPRTRAVRPCCASSARSRPRTSARVAERSTRSPTSSPCSAARSVGPSTPRSPTRYRAWSTRCSPRFAGRAAPARTPSRSAGTLLRRRRTTRPTQARAARRPSAPDAALSPRRHDSSPPPDGRDLGGAGHQDAGAALVALAERLDAPVVHRPPRPKARIPTATRSRCPCSRRPPLLDAADVLLIVGLAHSSPRPRAAPADGAVSPHRRRPRRARPERDARHRPRGRRRPRPPALGCRGRRPARRPIGVGGARVAEARARTAAHARGSPSASPSSRRTARRCAPRSPTTASSSTR